VNGRLRTGGDAAEERCLLRAQGSAHPPLTGAGVVPEGVHDRAGEAVQADVKELVAWTDEILALLRKAAI